MKIEDEIIKNNGSQFIGEFLDDLPDNAILNKVTTGSGMTSVVLCNQVKYVLAVPFKALIENKAAWCKERGIDLCAVYSGGANEDEIIAFKGNKIMTTYDSLGKVTKALENRGDLKEWKLCVDEAHKLVDSAIFRINAIETVLSNYEKYKSYVFGTATPVEDKHQLPALRHIRKVKIEWDNLIPVKVNYCHYEKRINDVVAIVALEFIRGQRDGNAHIFINSVGSIVHIIRKIIGAGAVNSDDIRIVCADTFNNRQTIESKLPDDYCISPVGSKVRKVNFYTATAFEGCDIYDEDGRSIIITDGKKDHTKIDIATVLPQIIGRVRNSKHKDTVSLFYTSNQYISNVSEREFEKLVLKHIEDAREVVKEYKLIKNPTLRKAAQEGLNDGYLLKDGDDIKVNETAWCNEMHNYSTINNTYYVSKDGTERTITDGNVTFNGIDYDYEGLKRIELKGLSKIVLGQKSSFKDLCDDYSRISKESPSMLRFSKINQIKEYDSLVVEAFEKLGEEKIKALKYRKGAIKDALLAISNEHNNNYKIAKMLGLRTGEWVSKSDLKLKLGEVYKKLDIKKSAKATDIVNWYDIRPANRSTNNKSVAGFEIGTCKVKIK